jgi:hypothetical protein
MDFMIAKGISSKKTKKLLAASALLVASAAASVLFATAILPAQTRQEEVAVKGAKEMPFDLEQTTHVFQKLDDGGLQKVVVKDLSNKKQVALIQSHLKEESEKFRKGDFSDPAKIHGEDMPGLAELKAGAAKINVRYSALPEGAQIRYQANDPKLVTRNPSMVFSTAFGPRRPRHTSLRKMLKSVPVEKHCVGEKGYSDIFTRM